MPAAGWLLLPLALLAGGAEVGLAAAASEGPVGRPVTRYALLVGVNQGHAHETPLRFAESDVDQVAATLESVGGFASDHIVRVKNADADRVRGALVDLGLTMQREVGRDSDAVLFVFFSGHGSAGALHLRGTTLKTEELSKLVRLQPARLKLLLVDSCRAGTLTRVKGGRQVAPFQIGLDETLRNEGYAVITSSAAGEDAQESDGLGSSVFTHHFLAAMRGLGDANRDRVITLGEAYGYAYTQSLRASMTTVVGSQHATFNYDLRGRADPVLADLRATGELATLVLADRGDYLIEPGHTAAAGAGALIEAHVSIPRTALAIPPGNYRVRYRTPDRVMQAEVTLARGAEQTLSASGMRALPLAQVIRKGEVAARLATGPMLAGSVHGPIGAGFSPAMGVQIGWAFDLRMFSLMPRVSFARSHSQRLGDTPVLSHELSDISLELGVAHVFDLGALSLAPMLSLGTALLWQDIAFAGGTSAQSRPVAFVTAVGGLASLPLGRGFSLEASAELLSYYLPRAQDRAPGGTQTFRAGTLTYRAGLGVAWRY